jgi:ribosome-associated translation inhibitor RaiA
MNYNVTDPKTNIAEKKFLKLEKTAKQQGLIDIEFRNQSTVADLKYKLSIQHAELLIFQRLIDVLWRAY